MSRIGNMPIELPKNVEVSLSEGNQVSVKGSKGLMTLKLPKGVQIEIEESKLTLINAKSNSAMLGTSRALLNNIVLGVHSGFEKKLLLTGVGYRAQVQGNKVVLSLGYSHQIEYNLPEGIAANCPNQTEIVISGADKQKVGQVAAEIREYRKPEPYKGKGVRYEDEVIIRKEVKKK